MKKQWMVLAAVMTALSITACGSGDGIMINGTTAAEAASDELGAGDAASQETTSGTKIEIVTGETTAAVETAAESTEGYTEAPVSQTQAETVAQTQTAATTQASTQPETTAAKVYKVTDVKKTMYATASVRVRSSYSTSSDVLAGLSKDEKVEVTGQSENGWLRVNYKGNVGYVSKDYLTEKAPQTTTTSQNNSSTTTTSSGTAAGGTATRPSTSTTTNSGTGPVGPTANNSGTTSGQTGGPGSGSTGNSNNTGNGGVGPGGATSPEGTTSPSGTTSSGNSASSSGTGTSGGNSVTGSVTALDPTGVTVQTSNGTTYQFVWGGDVPALAPGEKIQIYYETTSSGEKRVTSYSK